MKEMNNALSWFEIPALDINRARNFYEKIFEIEMQEMTVGTHLKMALFPVGAGTIGGALCEFKEFYRPGQDGPLVYLNADPDLQVVLERVRANHGRVIVGKTQISPEYGYMAVFEDCEGNRVALMSKS